MKFCVCVSTPFPDLEVLRGGGQKSEAWGFQLALPLFSHVIYIWLTWTGTTPRRRSNHSQKKRFLALPLLEGKILFYLSSEASNASRNVELRK